MKSITVLGSTGSVGTSTLDIIRHNRDRYQVYALVAGQNIKILLEQIQEFLPKVTVVATRELQERLWLSLDKSGLRRSVWPELLYGPQGRVEAAVAAEVDIVISAIVGVAGLEATYKAVKAGKRVGLANKEVLVSGGKLIMDAVSQSGSELIPVDSEHNGAHQCLRAGSRDAISQLILTASGGPFRNTPREEMQFVTPAQALNHPTWKMGNRITIDSATLMNKGFEVIEACWLFGFSPSQVNVVIHPQSSIHALIEYRDGSVLAQASATDMRMPIQYALSYPERDPALVPKIDWREPRKWEFFPPDLEKFPLLKLAYECQESGGSAACTLNAADEVAVGAFLEQKISFPAIHEVVSETLSRVPNRQPETISDILEVDEESRALAREVVNQSTSSRSAAVRF